MIQTGIFWVFNSKPFGLLSCQQKESADSLGLIDSEFQHVRDWEKAKKKAGLSDVLANKEYDEILRGRLIFDTQQNRYFVYSDLDQLLPSLRDTIKNWAAINGAKISWRHDVHYTLDITKRWGLLDE